MLGRMFGKTRIEQEFFNFADVSKSYSLNPRSFLSRQFRRAFFGGVTVFATEVTREYLLPEEKRNSNLLGQLLLECIAVVKEDLR